MDVILKIPSMDMNLRYVCLPHYSVSPSHLRLQIKACYFSGFQNQDVAFLHVQSKTLIEADLLFNLPGKEQVRLLCL